MQTNVQIKHTAAADPLQVLLARLDGLQKSGNGWRARCPACGGKSRKLAISDGMDGRVLVTCFDCHDTPAVMQAVGLSLSDLFPDRGRDQTPLGRRERRQAMQSHAWGAALAVVDREGIVLSIAANDLAKGHALNSTDHERLELARERIHAALGVFA